jgi:hypothetical protein
MMARSICSTQRPDTLMQLLSFAAQHSTLRRTAGPYILARIVRSRHRSESVRLRWHLYRRDELGGTRAVDPQETSGLYAVSLNCSWVRTRLSGGCGARCDLPVWVILGSSTSLPRSSLYPPKADVPGRSLRGPRSECNRLAILVDLARCTESVVRLSNSTLLLGRADGQGTPSSASREDMRLIKEQVLPRGWAVL